MFYSTQVLARKGPLGMVWLAAHMDNRLKKSNVFEANLVGSIESILNPEVPLALRLSGQLLLGVVNIYKKKVLYLFEDCNDAISKMQQAFKPGAPVLQNGGKANPIQVTITDDYLLGTMDQFNEEDFNYAAFDLSQPIDLGIGSKSLLMADDGAAVFTTPISYHDEQFEVDEEELERVFSLGSAERLRDAAVPAMQSLSGADTRSPRKDDEMLPEIPMDDPLFMGAAQPAPLPSPALSERRESDIGDMGIDTLDTALESPELDRPMLEVADEDAGEVPSPRRPNPARLRAGGKRKRAVRDTDHMGQPATVIPTAHIRALMADRAPLLKAQKRLTQASVRGTSTASSQRGVTSAEDWTVQPAILARLAPALQALYMRCLDQEHASPSKAAKHDEIQPNDQAEEELAEAAENGKTTSAVGNDTVSAGTLALAVVPPESQDGNLADTADLEAGGSGFENDFAMDASTPYEADVPLPTPSHRKQGSARRGSMSTSPNGKGSQPLDVQREEFSSRTEAVLQQVQARLRPAERSKQRGNGRSNLPFAELQSSSTPSEAAQLFFELLVLQARKQVELSQDMPYADISVALSSS